MKTYQRSKANKQNVYRKVLSYLCYVSVFVGAAIAFPAFADAATLSLSPKSGTYNADGTFEVKIQIDTGGAQAAGADVYLRFDPNVLQVADAIPGQEGVQILAGSIFSQSPYNQVDNANGKISFSAAKSGGSPGYSGSGTLATITFQALKEATATKVTFDYTQGSTTDSNIADQNSNDILSGVQDASYNINPPADPDAEDGPSPSPEAEEEEDGDSGSTAKKTTTGASGKSGTSGSGGSGTVAATGLDLHWYMVMTLVALVGAVYFLRRRLPKHR